MTPEATSSASREDALLSLWQTRLETISELHEMDGIMLNIMHDILDEQRRWQQERGFFWHIKAAFISLLSE